MPAAKIAVRHHERVSGTAATADVVNALRAAGCVFAEDEARLLVSAAHAPAELASMVDRRVSGVPLEYVLGWAEFCGLRIVVEPGVFVPRRRTEFLVHRAVAAARDAAASRKRTDSERTRLVVVDLCCGSGAIGLAVGSSLNAVELHAVDVDPAAVRCARRNLAAAGGTVYEGDLYRPLPRALHGTVDVLIANAPYVPTGEVGMLPPEARLYEPRTALDGGPDGLDVQRRVIAEASSWLAPSGHLLIETSDRQAPATAESFELHRLAATVAHSDDYDGTVVVGTRRR
jgi:release factor glutamine methyltransferase